jgi:hypothetical protein
MAVSMATTGRTPEMGAPVALFQPRILHGGLGVIGFLAQYDVAPDGRFLINVTAGDAVTALITVIQNWAPKKQTRSPPPSTATSIERAGGVPGDGLSAMS